MASMASWLLLLAHTKNYKKYVRKHLKIPDKLEKSCFLTGSSWLLLEGSEVQVRTRETREGLGHPRDLLGAPKALGRS